jgi:hypothetical protein
VIAVLCAFVTWIALMAALWTWLAPALGSAASLLAIALLNAAVVAACVLGAAAALRGARHEHGAAEVRR